MSVRKRVINKGGRSVQQYFVDFRFQHPDGNVERVRKDSPVNTLRGAEQYERELRQALLNGTYSRSKEEAKTEKVQTMNDFVEDFLTYSTNNNKPSAVHAKRYILRLHLQPYFGAMPLDAIGPEAIERYKDAKRHEGLKPKSVNNQLTVLRKLLNLAVEWQRIPHAPKVRALKLPDADFEFLTFEETERFLAAAEPEWRTMLTLALKTGLRSGELLALKWEDIDLKAGRLIVKRTLWQDQEGTPKGGKRREIPLSQQTVAMLSAHRHLRGPYVFCTRGGQRLTHSMVKRVVPATCRRAQLGKELTMHDLRHTFASHLVMRGRSLKEVQELLGHSTITMTMRYAHLAPDVKRAAVEVLDTLPAQPVGNGWATEG